MIGLGTIGHLRKEYATGRVSPREVAFEARKRALAAHEAVWIHVLAEDELAEHLDRLESLDFEKCPLWGVPFAIKDNIDLAGVPTTAGCPDFAYEPQHSAYVVARLLDAGAIPIGKTNLDQFATGLTGTRSPYGSVPNAIDPQYLAGGSSSGSAVAVKSDSVVFALGTDTAGSGRLPAAFNGLVGFKPTRGWWSTRGVVPACRTLDCVSVFTKSVADAQSIAEIAGEFDDLEPFSRIVESRSYTRASPQLAYLNPDKLPWLDDTDYESSYRLSTSKLPNTAYAVDPEPFLAAGQLLYEGPWLAERVVAVGDFIKENPTSVQSLTRSIIESGRTLPAVECFRSQYRLAELRRAVAEVFKDIDVLAMPTAPTHYTRAEVERDPFVTNSNLGTFSHCVNLLDLCAVAIPSGTTSKGMPFGITLLSEACFDIALLREAAGLLDEQVTNAQRKLNRDMYLAVCGAHMSGQPLNPELIRRGGYCVRRTRTTPSYRLYALPDGVRPALLRVESEGVPIEVEVWALPETVVGDFVGTVEFPLAIGSVELEEGEWVHGFVGDASAASGALDISSYGGWRDYKASL